MVKFDLCRQLFGPITTAPLTRSEKNVPYSFFVFPTFVISAICLFACLICEQHNSKSQKVWVIFF